MKLYRYIPDCITSLNILCGVLGVVAAFESRVDIAFFFMIAAAVFDFCDGFAARALNAYSDLGKELDSLCDVVSFGVLPAVMLHCNMVACTFTTSFWTYVPVLIAVFSAIRLAKFNVDERQHSSFLGLATPVCALLCASFCFYVAYNPVSVPAQWCGSVAFVPAACVVLCALLVCEIPMFSFKIGKGADKKDKFKVLSFLAECAVIAAIVFVLGMHYSMIILLCCLLYIVKNVVYAVFNV